MTRPCSIDGCDRLQKCRGWCQTHYTRWQRHGDPAVALKDKGGPRRFVESVAQGTAPVEPNGCIFWPYAIDNYGYATATTSTGSSVAAGRLVLERVVGPAPTPEHQMGHAPHEVCGNRHCVAPAHLSWQTPLEQARSKRRDGSYKHPTHCKHGHEFTPENTYVRTGRSGEPWRACRECHRLHAQADRDKKRADR